MTEKKPKACENCGHPTDAHYEEEKGAGWICGESEICGCYTFPNSVLAKRMGLE